MSLSFFFAVVLLPKEEFYFSNQYLKVLFILGSGCLFVEYYFWGCLRFVPAAGLENLV